MFFKIWLSVGLISFVVADDIVIGGIFDDDEDYQNAFEFAFNYTNSLGMYGGITLTPLIKTVPPDDAFAASQAFCDILGAGAFGVFGPTSQENVDAVQSVCDNKEMPQVLTKWRPYNLIRGNTILNMYPYPKVLAKAYIDIIQEWDWQEFIVLYDSDDSFSRLTTLLNYASELKMYAVLRQLDNEGTGIYRTVLKEVRNAEIKNIVLDCEYKNLQEILRQAQQIGMMSAEYNFFITNLDLHTLSLTDYQFSSVKILGIRLVSPESKLVQEVSKEFLKSDDPLENLLNLAAWKLRSDMALVIDAVSMFLDTMNKLNLETYVVTQDLSCNSSESWKDGLSVLNLMKTNRYKGLTGEIRFDKDGLRTEFYLEIIELREGGIIEVGRWNSSAHPSLELKEFSESQIFNDEESLKNRTFKVEVCLTEPYAMWKNSPNNLEGNDQFEGFGIDLIEELAKLEGFRYEFQVRADSDNGGRLPDGNWSGMIGDLRAHICDLAIADLTITSEREQAVDFTDAFMSLGISILYEKAKKAPPSFFSFAEPFSYDTWGTLLASVVLVALSYYVIARVVADEWTNPDPCKEDPPFLTNQFNMKNSFWFTIASLMQQGTEIAPIDAATRAITGAWWFFILIIVASYTANLTAFLSTEKPDYLFKNLHELVTKAKELEITYGAKKGGATYKFFNQTGNDDYMKVFDYMTAHPENMEPENKLGVERAKGGKYAFFMESTSIEYATERNCELEKVGETLDPNKGYAIAMRKYSPYRKRLNLAILKLQSQGILEIMKKKWWQERRGGGACKDDESAGPEAAPLTIKNVEGVFYVTVYGMAFAVILAICEWIAFIAKMAKKKKVTFLQSAVTEFRFFINFEELVKPLKGTSSSKSSKSARSSVSRKSSISYRMQYRLRSRFRFGSRARSGCRSMSRSPMRSRSRSQTKPPISRPTSIRSKSSSRSKRQSKPIEMAMFRTVSTSPMRYGFKAGPSQERLTENME